MHKHIHTMHYQQTTMSHQLPDKYWDSLGPNGLFLHEPFHNQSQLVAQLQATNNNLQTGILDALDDVANAASSCVSCGTNDPHQCTGTGWRPANKECQSSQPRDL